MESMSSYFSTGIGGAISLSTIAFVTVFAVLTGLTFIIMGVRVLAAPFQGGPPAGRGSSTSKPSPAPKPAPPAAVKQGAAQAPASGGTDPRILAAITAAIAAGTSGSFRISSVTPARTQSAGRPYSMWRQASRMEGFEKLDRQVWKSR